jgi:hypothetical protein
MSTSGSLAEFPLSEKIPLKLPARLRERAGSPGMAEMAGGQIVSLVNNSTTELIFHRDLLLSHEDGN